MKCCDCDKRFPSVTELELHLTSEHLEWFPYECRICAHARFPTENILHQHFAQIHSMEPVAVSRLCSVP